MSVLRQVQPSPSGLAGGGGGMGGVGRLRVLHIWDVSGVAGVLAKYMDRSLGTSSKVLVRGGFDRFGFGSYAEVFSHGPTLFGLKCLFEARKFDILLVHSWHKIVPWLKALYGKPVVLTFHNLTTKYRWQEWAPAIRRADAVTVVSGNLLKGAPSGATLIPNPVDTDLFFDLHQHARGTALYSNYYAQEEAMVLAKAKGIGKVDILDRWKNPVPYRDMPALLAKYEYFIDVRRSPRVSDEIIDCVSKNALEALACGTKVIAWDGRVLESLPEEDKPDNAARAYFELYQSLLGKRGA